MERWQKVLMAAGGAVGIGAVLYYLLKDEEAEPDTQPASASAPAKTAAVRKGAISPEDLQEILNDMVSAQQVVKSKMKEISQEIGSEGLGFPEAYAKVKENQPKDPLEKHGLTMEDLDAALQLNQSNPQVMAAMYKLMGAPDPVSASSAKPKALSVAQIIEINEFMVQELQNIIADFQGRSDKSSYDMQTVLATSQAIMDSKVNAKFGCGADDLEAAVMANQQALSANAQFLQASQQMQQTMETFIRSNQ